SETALGRDWIEAAERALRDPLSVELPYREEGYLSADEAPALGFLVELERGQRLSVDLEIVGEPVRVFVDLYRSDPSGERRPLFVASADSATNELAYTVGRSG
ncbi:MAG: M23 family peptidase, partial [Gammaproteobacteria bacterium]|nr:M23 family peptidase [Gammaproteobacteria bacterium]